MFIFLSVNNIVIAPASTGKDNNNKNAVTKTDQGNKASRCIVRPRARIFQIVVIKFKAPKIDEIPAKCNENIAKSTAGPECAGTLLKGGYTVQPVPAPASTKLELINKVNAGGNNQKLILFKRGKAMSGAAIIIGTNQLPNKIE